ncbi:hypothetical protein OIU77_021480 [Salix suchowensis]|uniref:DUF7054 domain-containing protein n=1 Tax=Salix suchowensis TaxID=1278906 RepID=A0ABQ9CAW5_9ROSI|nr:hypothetical protein OIU78_000654 [Salix suchowensis]KAJ6396453.1 hypothetical protein OIU77_021480 [Salix suchowensis]
MEKMKRNVSEKMKFQKQMKNKKGDDKKNRFLVSINFVGSAGPIRFVVNGDDLVSGVIDTALKTYARGGRLPVLGFDVNKFLLYCANPASDALNPWEPIGSQKGKEFYAVQETVATTKDRDEFRNHSRKTNIWVEGMAHQVFKLIKSLSCKIYSQ